MLMRTRWLRIAYLACCRFYLDKCALNSSSLTYYTLMSLVPMLAMSIAIARGFGYSDVMREQLLERFQDQKEILAKLFDYADLFLEQAKGGAIAGLGVLILFFTVALLLRNLESILNHIWQVKRIRNWRRIFTDYLSIMLVAPIFFIFASSASVFVVDLLESWVQNSLLLFFIHIIPYGLFWILFSFIYLFMPNCNVQIRSAMLGGVVAACLYLIVQWGYIYFQLSVSQYGLIYGNMAALPLLLIWIQLSWFIILFGAEISHAHQTADEHELTR